MIDSKSYKIEWITNLRNRFEEFIDCFLTEEAITASSKDAYLISLLNKENKEIEQLKKFIGNYRLVVDKT